MDEFSNFSIFDSGTVIIKEISINGVGFFIVLTYIQIGIKIEINLWNMYRKDNLYMSKFDEGVVMDSKNETHIENGTRYSIWI